MTRKEEIVVVVNMTSLCDKYLSGYNRFSRRPDLILTLM